MAAPTVRETETGTAAMARTYAEMGWKVFPLWWVTDGRCACPLGADCGSPGKHPIGKLDGRWMAPRGVHDATDHRPTIVRWWTLAPDANIGLPADANGLAIVDVDPRHQGHLSWLRLQLLLTDHDPEQHGDRPWPTTVVQTTGSGGEHHLFAAPASGIASTKRAFGAAYPGLDTRGRGGYVVAAPSTHASGGVYRWASRGFLRRHLLDHDTVERPLLARWPVALTRLMATAPATVEDARAALDVFAERRRPAPEADANTIAEVARWAPERTARYVVVTVAAELDALRKTTEGGRNDQLNRAAYAVGRFIPPGLLDETVAFGELCRAGLAAGLEPDEVPKTVLSGLAAGKARPARHLPATRTVEA